MVLCSNPRHSAAWRTRGPPSINQVILRLLVHHDLSKSFLAISFYKIRLKNQQYLSLLGSKSSGIISFIMKNLQYAKHTEIVFLQKMGLCLRLLPLTKIEILYNWFFLNALNNLPSYQFFPDNNSAFSFSIPTATILIQTPIIRLPDYCHIIWSIWPRSLPGQIQIHPVYCLPG